MLTPTDSQVLATLLRHVNDSRADAIEAHVAVLVSGLEVMRALLLEQQATLSAVCGYLNEHIASGDAYNGWAAHNPTVTVQ